ncbi:MAG TPA: FHA domain-containing protein [Gemmatimonadaceae bacterium]|nr:FHA domain-containing protein [Gemmatimonadaceae bacterium]
MSPELHVHVAGEGAPRRFQSIVRVGRGPGNDIVLEHDVVSSQHLEVRPVDDRWEVVDLGSTNGTFVDGSRITTWPVTASTTVRLGMSGPALQLTIPSAVKVAGTRELNPMAAVERWFSPEAPLDMSPHTRMVRAAVQERRQQEQTTWMQRIRRYRVGVAVLAVAAVVAGGVALVQARRVAALRQTAASVFGTIKELELDVRRLEATSGPNPGLAEKRARLEKQYEDLVKTLGIYNDRTPLDEQIIYRTIHRLGESEANVPSGFVRELREHIARWKAADLQAGFARARQQGLAGTVGPILLRHNLPREFLFLALQESKFDPRAIGPSTASGVPKGMWQLTPLIAETYGLQLGPLRGERAFDAADERHDVARASEAAARYLEDLYTTDAKLSGLLVVASYNMGETRMRRIIRSMPDSPSERNLWKLLERHRKEIPAETYDYMFRVLSAAVIATNPRAFGFDLDPLVAGE